MKILSWNLFHGRVGTGRTDPAATREAFFAALAGWDWDVALLQEVPPWWPGPLAERCDASVRTVLTSRNELLAVRRFLAERWPDLIKSGGGGCNAILVRDERIAEHRTVRLRRRPERRWMHAVRLDSGVWVGNLHAQTQPRPRPEQDIAKAAAALTAWAPGDTPAALGGDFNIPDPAIAGFVRAASHGVDHVLVRGLRVAGPREVLGARPLSDHRPFAVEVRP